MGVRCDFCGQTTERDHRAALKDGWYSHELRTFYLKKTLRFEAIRLGHVCPACVAVTRHNQPRDEWGEPEPLPEGAAEQLATARFQYCKPLP
jgi:hypothetical protein